MTKRKRRLNPRPQLAPADPIMRELQRCTDAQEQLTKAQQVAIKWQHQRRQLVRAAFAAGASTRQLADALGVSRTKIYRLIGSARAV